MAEFFLDTLGELCPVPLLRAEMRVKTMSKDDVLVLETDHSCTARLLPKHLRRYRCRCDSRVVADGIWQVIIRRA